MKTLGIVRRIDDLGRVVIPKEVRQNAGIREGDALEIVLVQMNGKWCPMFAPYDPNTPGIDLAKVEDKDAPHLITLRDCCENEVYHLTLGEPAYQLFMWLWNQGALNGDWEWENGHNIAAETFV